MLTIGTLLLTATLIQEVKPPPFNPKPWSGEEVRFKTEDDVEIVGELWRVVPMTWHEAQAGIDAPTVICLPMFRHTQETYKPLVVPLLKEGINVLKLDLRGHGKSAPELAEKVQARDAELFNAAYRDVSAAVKWLESEGFDPTRIGLVGASVGCSVAAATAVREPGPIRGVVLMTPGAKYLGVDTLADAEKWRGTPLLILSSKEESPGVNPVVEAFRKTTRDLEYDVFKVSAAHGTRMFGKVENVETQIASWLAARLKKSPRLMIPRFREDDERVGKGGFVGQTARIGRVIGETRFELLAFVVGQSLTLGAMVQGKFAGTIEMDAGGRILSFPMVTGMLPKDGVAVQINGRKSELLGQAAGFRDWSWVNVEIPLAEYASRDRLAVRLRYLPHKAEPVSIPSGDVRFDAHIHDR